MLLSVGEYAENDVEESFIITAAQLLQKNKTL